MLITAPWLERRTALKVLKIRKRRIFLRQTNQSKQVSEAYQRYDDNKSFCCFLMSSVIIKGCVRSQFTNNHLKYAYEVNIFHCVYIHIKLERDLLLHQEISSKIYSNSSFRRNWWKLICESSYPWYKQERLYLPQVGMSRIINFTPQCRNFQKRKEMLNSQFPCERKRKETLHNFFVGLVEIIRNFNKWNGWQIKRNYLPFYSTRQLIGLFQVIKACPSLISPLGTKV